MLHSIHSSFQKNNILHLLYSAIVPSSCVCVCVFTFLSFFILPQWNQPSNVFNMCFHSLLQLQFNLLTFFVVAGRSAVVFFFVDIYLVYILFSNFYYMSFLFLNNFIAPRLRCFEWRICRSPSDASRSTSTPSRDTSRGEWSCARAWESSSSSIDECWLVALVLKIVEC